MVIFKSVVFKWKRLAFHPCFFVTLSNEATSTYTNLSVRKYLWVTILAKTIVFEKKIKIWRLKLIKVRRARSISLNIRIPFHGCYVKLYNTIKQNKQRLASVHTQTFAQQNKLVSGIRWDLFISWVKSPLSKKDFLQILNLYVLFYKLPVYQSSLEFTKAALTFTGTT